MKYVTIFLTCVTAVFMWGCPPLPADVNPGYSAYEPILADRSSLDNIVFSEPATIVNSGKIYAYAQYVLVNEVDKGYHIIDNSDPSQPKNVGFLSIPASRDAVGRNGILYCDNATDMISVDVSDIRNPKVLSRIENIFPHSEPPDGLPPHPDYTAGNRPDNTVVIEWRVRQ